jgi:hypothetical protein
MPMFSIYEIMERCSLNDRQFRIENTDVRDDFISTPFPGAPMNGEKNLIFYAYKIGSRLNVISARTYNFPFVKPSLSTG